MKKIMILCIAIILLSACSNTSQTQINNLGIEIPQHSTLKDKSDFGWFNDGDDFKILSFDDANNKKMVDSIKNNQQWNSLPLSPIIQLITYDNEEKQSVIHDDNGNNLIPEIKNGYYYFLDRSNNQDFKNADILNLSFSSYNFTLAIYDTDNAQLYYYYLNT